MLGGAFGAAVDANDHALFSTSGGKSIAVPVRAPQIGPAKPYD